MGAPNPLQQLRQRSVKHLACSSLQGGRGALCLPDSAGGGGTASCPFPEGDKARDPSGYLRLGRVASSSPRGECAAVFAPCKGQESPRAVLCQQRPLCPGRCRQP